VHQLQLEHFARLDEPASSNSAYAEQSPRRSWIGTFVGNLPFLFTLAVYIAASARLEPFDQGIRLVLSLFGAEVLVTVVCLLNKPLRYVGFGLCISPFFTPVASMFLGLIFLLF
jgi:hypothetical protein